MVVDKLADFNEGDDSRDSSHFKQKYKGKELQKKGKGQAAKKEEKGSKTRQGESSFKK